MEGFSAEDVVLVRVPFPLPDVYKMWSPGWNEWIRTVDSLTPRTILRPRSLRSNWIDYPGYELRRGGNDRNEYLTRWVHQEWVFDVVPVEERIRKYVELNFKTP